MPPTYIPIFSHHFCFILSFSPSPNTYIAMIPPLLSPALVSEDACLSCGSPPTGPTSNKPHITTPTSGPRYEVADVVHAWHACRRKTSKNLNLKKPLHDPPSGSRYEVGVPAEEKNKIIMLEKKPTPTSCRGLRNLELSRPNFHPMLLYPYLFLLFFIR